LKLQIWKIAFVGWRRTVPNLGSRIKKLEEAGRSRWERLLEEEFARHSDEELEFFADHGYWPETETEVHQ
jgi:hypothetical protein